MGVTVKSTEVLDAFDIGKRYTGVDATFGASFGSKFRYGFILVKDTKYNITNMLSGEQVILPFPPQSITEEEPSATVITPTLNSGKYIERRGQIMKTITLSGTTGYNYNPQLPAVVRGVLPTPTIVSIEGPNSGLAQFIRLRNLFRKYWEIFSLPDNVEARSSNPVLIFVNEKDGEHWIVEPTSFRMSRQTPRNKFTYQYDITLQTIALVDRVFLAVDPLTIFETLANVRNTIRSITNDFTRIVAGIGDILFFTSGAIGEALEAVVNTMEQINAGFQSIAQGVQSFSNIKELVTNRFMTDYENVLDTRDAIEAQTGSDPLPDDTYSLLSEAALICANLAGRDELYDPLPSDNWKDVLQYYDPAYGIGGYNETLVAPLTQDGVREGEIFPEDDIVSISIRELGSAERYQELVVLNNLRYPYLSPNRNERLPNTLAPGDSILLPVRRSQGGPRVKVVPTTYVDPSFTGDVVVGGSTTCTLAPDRDWRADQWTGFTAEILDGTGAGQERKVLSNNGTQFTVDTAWTTTPAADSVIHLYLKRIDEVQPTKSANDQLLGIDVRLDETKDIKSTAVGDVSLVSGIDNMVQAVYSKMNTAPGELPAHPYFGLSTTATGTKVNASNILGYKLAVRQTLLSDKRVDSVDQLNVVADGDTVKVEGYALLRGRSQPFAIDTRGGK